MVWNLGLRLADEDLGSELIALAGHGDDQSGVVPQGAAQLGDVLGQVALFHKRA